MISLCACTVHAVTDPTEEITGAHGRTDNLPHGGGEPLLAYWALMGQKELWCLSLLEGSPSQGGTQAPPQPLRLPRSQEKAACPLH